MPKADAVFAIDGYEVSATFAEKRNQAALSQVKQILLSSFANNASKARPTLLKRGPWTSLHYRPSGAIM